MTLTRILFFAGLLATMPMLASCNMIVMSPAGDIAVQQRNLILLSAALMLVIILPVIGLTLYFAWRYRESNQAAYDPEWSHSLRLEVLIWAAPLLIIIMLGGVTWVATHRLDPYNPLQRIDASRSIPVELRPLTVEVVAMDWKWLFLYPEYGVAAVNELALPVDVPVAFKITSTSVMNSFYAPALAGQIYAMPGMQTRLHAVLNKTGEYRGFSANYSGEGFSHMRFRLLGLDQERFGDWIAAARRNGTALNRDAYLNLEKPSIRDSIRHFSQIEPGLYQAVVNRCVRNEDTCWNETEH